MKKNNKKGLIYAFNLYANILNYLITIIYLYKMFVLVIFYCY